MGQGLPVYQKEIRAATGYQVQPGEALPTLETPMLGSSTESQTRVGQLVQYYDGGWRYGYVAEETKARVRVRPIGAYKAAIPRCVWCSKSDVKEILVK